MPSQHIRAYTPGAGNGSNTNKRTRKTAIRTRGSSHSGAYWQQVGLPPRGAKLHDAITEGVPYSVYKKLAKLTGIDQKALAVIVSIPPATLQRRAKSGRFTREESDRLFRLAELYKAATDLFEGDQDGARQWLHEPVRGLGGRRPVDMLNTSVEARAVMELIGRLEHGVTV
ncbi:MAG: type II RES/Xre toxin-antitoxin system antitoxin [Pseudomonadales bacterium]